MSFPRYPKYKDSGVEWLGDKPFFFLTARPFLPMFTPTIPARPLNNAQIGGLLISGGNA